jgi:hypothetical protein
MTSPGNDASRNVSAICPILQGRPSPTKFRTRPEGVAADAGWLREQTRRELERWEAPDSKRSKARRPEYLIIATNVVLSPAAESGGIDAFTRLMEQWSDRLGLRGWAVWHYDHLGRLLDGHADVRRAYAALITPGDVLARLHDMLDGAAPDLGEVMRRHAAKELLAEQWVRLGDAGDATNSKLTLGSVAIDLAATRPNNEQPVDVAAYVIRHGDAVLRPTAGRRQPISMVVVGGPGQGKTTISQLITQAYRAALLQPSEQPLGADAEALLTSLTSDLQAIGLPTPSSRRWPIRVELAAYADAIMGGEDVSLLRHLADRISRRGPETVTPVQLKTWLGSWPWLLVLDGLDEVAASDTRDSLMQAVDDLLVDAAAVDADLLIVATTRPQGYLGEFFPAHSEHLYLQPLDKSEAVRYARRLSDVRHHNDEDMARKVVQRVEKASRQEITARLMRSPLQVTIMSLLLERRERAPQDRHGLFEAYYDTIYSRETAKPGPTALLLEQYRNHVTAIHEQVGLRIQVDAEGAGDPGALIAPAEMRRIAIQRLVTEGLDVDEAERLADRLVSAATDRLVLLVPQGPEQVGFEVRSLQEFMAARALVDGPDDIVLRRLEALVPSVHWRNTWQFAVGRVFARTEHLREAVIGLLTKVDVADRLAMLWLPGAQLAVNLLDDDLAATSPQFRRMLAERVVALIDTALSYDARTLGRVLYRAATGDTVIRALAEQAVDRAMDTVGDRRSFALSVLDAWAKGTGPMAARARQRLATVAAWSQIVDLYESQLIELVGRTSITANDLKMLTSYVDVTDVDADGRDLLYDFLTARRLSFGELDSVFTHAGARDALAAAIESVRRPDWRSAYLVLMYRIGHWFNIRPRGPEILDTFTQF